MAEDGNVALASSKSTWPSRTAVLQSAIRPAPNCVIRIGWVITSAVAVFGAGILTELRHQPDGYRVLTQRELSESRRS